MKMALLFAFFINILIIRNSKTEDEIEIILTTVSGKKDEKIGRKNGIIPFYLQGKDVFNESDIEEKTIFNMTINGTKTGNIYPLKCRLWKQIYGSVSSIFLFCELMENLKCDETIIINKNSLYISFNYSIYKITIKFEKSEINLKLINGEKPFIYSSYQKINITENQEKIKLEFNFISYNNELLYLKGAYTETQDKILYLDSCKVESKKIKCEIQKDKLVSLMHLKSECFYLCYVNEIEGFTVIRTYIGEINFIIPPFPKEDIYLSIVNLFDNKSDRYYYFTYETNLTNFTSIRTNDFQKNNIDCYFIKHDNSTPLYLLCRALDKASSNFIFDDYRFELNNIHYRYNFIVAAGTNKKEIIFSQIEKYIVLYHIYPEIINFNLTNSTNILFIGRGVNRMNNIKFNLKGNDLQCIDLFDNGNFYHIKKCEITKSHFKKVNSGYYIPYHKNSFNEFNTNYETRGIYVIKPNNDDDESDEGDKDDKKSDEPNQKSDKKNFPTLYIVLISIGGIIIIAIAIFLIIRYVRKNKRTDLTNINEKLMSEY